MAQQNQLFRLLHTCTPLLYIIFLYTIIQNVQILRQQILRLRQHDGQHLFVRACAITAKKEFHGETKSREAGTPCNAVAFCTPRRIASDNSSAANAPTNPISTLSPASCWPSPKA